MQFALEGGTETGSMLLFDPMSLPPEIDERQRRPRKVLDKLGENGVLYRIPGNSDGWFTLRVCVDEPLPSTLEEFAKLEDSDKPIHVEKGTLFFAGGEYAFHRDDSLLLKYPTMGGHECVPAGDYRLSLYSLTYPKGFHEAMIEERSTKSDCRMRIITYGMGFAQAFLWVFFLTLFFILPWRFTLYYVLPLAGVTTLGTWLLLRARAFARTEEQKKLAHREFSDYLMVLRRERAAEALDYSI